jgi:hypothetical protein
LAISRQHSAEKVRQTKALNSGEHFSRGEILHRIDRLYMAECGWLTADSSPLRRRLRPKIYDIIWGHPHIHFLTAWFKTS